MRTPFDQFAKQLLEQALSRAGQVTTDAEVLADVQRMDVWYVPDPDSTALLRDLRMLGRMAMGTCGFEPFHEAPSVADVLDCLRKQLTLELSAQGRERWQTSHPNEPPLMWVIAAGRPTHALHALAMAPLKGWPRGVYAAAPALRVRVVVIPELPVTRDTLLVRLMGTGRVLREAVAELRRLPPDAAEHGVAGRAMVVFRAERPEAADLTDEQRELMMTSMEVYENWRLRTLAEGKAEGKAEGVEQGLAPLVYLFERRLGRPLTDREHAVLRQRLDTVGAARLGGVVLDLDAPALSDWLADPTVTCSVAVRE